MDEELKLIIKKALILVGKIQYLKEYDTGKRQLLHEFIREYIREIEPEFLKMKGVAEVDEIMDIFKEYATEEERKISEELDFLDNVSREKIR